MERKEFTGYLMDTSGVEFEAFFTPSLITDLGGLESRAYIPWEGIHEIEDLMGLGETTGSDTVAAGLIGGKSKVISLAGSTVA